MKNVKKLKLRKEDYKEVRKAVTGRMAEWREERGRRGESVAAKRGVERDWTPLPSHPTSSKGK